MRYEIWNYLKSIADEGLVYIFHIFYGQSVPCPLVQRYIMYKYLLSRHLYDYCKDQLQIMNLLKKNRTELYLSILLISLTTSRNEVKKFFKIIWLKKNISLQPLLILRRFILFTCLAVGSVPDIEQKKMIILIFFSFWESPCLHKKVNWKTVPVLFLVLPCHSISSQIKFSSLF